MTDSQVKAILGDLIKAEKIKIPLLVVFLVIGILLLVAGACCIKRLKNSEYAHVKESFSSEERN